MRKVSDTRDQGSGAAVMISSTAVATLVTFAEYGLIRRRETIMDPFDVGMRQLQQMAGMNEKQAVLSKRTSALELTRVEGEIAVAKARVKVADAEIAKLRLTLASAEGDEAATAHIEALIAAATAERDARLGEVEALTSYLGVKKEIAELALEVDPDAMNQVVALITGMMGDDPENPSTSPG